MVEKGEEPIEIGRCLQRFAVEPRVRNRNIRLFMRACRMGDVRGLHRFRARLHSRVLRLSLARTYGVTVFRQARTCRRIEHLRHCRLQIARRRLDARSGNGGKSLGVEFRQNVEIGKDITFHTTGDGFRRDIYRSGSRRNVGDGYPRGRLCKVFAARWNLLSRRSHSNFHRFAIRTPRCLHRRG